MRRCRLAVALLVCGAGPSAFAGGAATDAYDDIANRVALDVHALVDVYVQHDFNRPASGLTQLREFDFHSDLPSLGWLRLTLAHHPRRLGFRLDVGIGDTSDRFLQSDPAAPTHPELSRWASRVAQGFITVVVPLGPGIAIDVGKFETPVGLEDNESPANWSYSRSLLYSWAEPSLHTGVRLSCRATRKLALSLFWLNGWNANFIDGSDLRSFAGAVTWKPLDQIEVVLVYMGGLEPAPTLPSAARLSLRNLVDAYVVYTPVRRVAVALTADYGNDRAGGGVNWWGVAGYARVEVSRWSAAAVRGEYLADPDGFMTGTRQSLAEATATLEAQTRREGARLVARLECRHDQSTARVFEATPPPARSRQDTLTLALLALF